MQLNPYFGKSASRHLLPLPAAAGASKGGNVFTLKHFAPHKNKKETWEGASYSHKASEMNHGENSSREPKFAGKQSRM